jgi:DNA-binding MarR family transcriptional regulator
LRRAAGAVKTANLDLTMLEPSGLHKHIGFMLRLANAAVLRDFAQAIEEFKLRPAEYACLVVIQAEPGLNQQRIGQILNIKHSNLVAVINALEGRGFIDRARPTRDRRTNFIYLTKSGTQFLERLGDAVKAHNQRIVQRVGRRNLATMLNSLNHLAQLGSDPA